MIGLRTATLADLAEILPRTRAFNAEEGITVEDAALETATRTLLADANLGEVWLVERDAIIGHAVVTYGYDLEYAGRDAYLTEIWIDEHARGHGAGSAVLERLADELRARDVRALHLEVRPDNPALRLYERHGFVPSRRLALTKTL
jgi:ribosomal protein S18 acetylase RimI-like enzyme